VIIAQHDDHPAAGETSLLEAIGIFRAQFLQVFFPASNFSMN
jgi:hypothetical protein